MTSSIDFLQGKRLSAVKREKYYRYIKVGSVIILLFYCLFIAAISSYGLYLNGLSLKVEQQIVDKKKRIADHKKTELMQVLAKQRLGNINKILFERSPSYSQLIDRLTQVTPGGVFMTDIKMTNGEKVALKGTALNSISLDRLLDNLLEEKETTKYFSKIIILTAGRREDGVFAFELSLETNAKR